MKTVVLGCLLAVVLTSTASAQTIVGEPERLWGEGDIIDGETLGRLREGAVDDAGHVASHPEAGIGSARVVLATINGIPTVIARAGDAAPGGDVIELFIANVEQVGDLVLYTALALDDDPNNFLGDAALLLRDVNEANPVVVARTNVTLVPGRAVPFSDLFTLEGYGLAPGRLAFTVAFVDGDAGQGVYLWENGSLSKIADTDDSFDGLPFVSFNNAKPDENGPGIIFEAERQDGGQEVESIFLYEGGNLTELIAAGDPFPGSAGSIDFLDTPAFDGGRVALRLRGSDGEEGVFVVDSEGNTTLVADLNTPLPDSPDNTGPATGFDDSVGIGGGLVYFRATRPAGSDEPWIWGDGTFEPALTRGDVLDGREVSSAAGSVVRHSMSRTAVVIRVSFVDGPDTLYRIPLSQPISSMQAQPGAVPVPLPWWGTLSLAVLSLLLGRRVLARRKFTI